MRSGAVRVIFSTVANQGRQFGGPIGNCKGLVDTRQTKGRKGGDFLIGQFEAFVEIRVADRPEFIYSRYG
jgi:hypothetical protein